MKNSSSKSDSHFTGIGYGSIWRRCVHFCT